MPICGCSSSGGVGHNMGAGGFKSQENRKRSNGAWKLGEAKHRQTHRHTDRHTHTDTQIHAHRHRDTETQRHTNRHTHRHTPTFFTPGFSRTEWDMSSLSHSCRSAGRRRGEGHGRGMRRSRKRKQGWGEGRVAATASIGECQVAYVWSFR